MITRIAAIGLALAATLGFAAPSLARPVTDCPLRDAPFSATSPMVDLMLSDAARAVLGRYSDGKLAKVPDRFLGTTPPTFAAILTLKEAARFTGMTDAQIASADAELRNAFGAESADRFAEQFYLAFRGFEEADDGRDAGGLAGAIAPEQRQHAARPQGKTDAVQHMAVAVKGVQVGQTERVRGQDTPPASARPRSPHPARQTTARHGHQG